MWECMTTQRQYKNKCGLQTYTRCVSLDAYSAQKLPHLCHPVQFGALVNCSMCEWGPPPPPTATAKPTEAARRSERRTFFKAAEATATTLPPLLYCNNSHAGDSSSNGYGGGHSSLRRGQLEKLSAPPTLRKRELPVRGGGEAVVAWRWEKEEEEEWGHGEVVDVVGEEEGRAGRGLRPWERVGYYRSRHTGDSRGRWPTSSRTRSWSICQSESASERLRTCLALFSRGCFARHLCKLIRTPPQWKGISLETKGSSLSRCDEILRQQLFSSAASTLVQMVHQRVLLHDKLCIPVQSTTSELHVLSIVLTLQSLPLLLDGV